MSASIPRRRRFGGAATRAEAVERAVEALGEADRRLGRVLRISAERPGDPAGAVRVVERELAEHAGAEHRDVLPACACRGRDGLEVQQRPDVDALEALGRRDEQPCPVRRGQDQRRRRGLTRQLARGVAEVEALDVLEPPLARERRGALHPGERPRLVDLRAAEDALVPRGERLRHRRGRTEDVDDDAQRSRGLLARREGHVDTHREGYASPNVDHGDEVLLPPPRPAHRPVVLGVRSPDLHRLHDGGAGRSALPRPRGRPEPCRRSDREAGARSRGPSDGSAQRLRS